MIPTPDPQISQKKERGLEAVFPVAPENREAVSEGSVGLKTRSGWRSRSLTSVFLKQLVDGGWKVKYLNALIKS